MQGRPPCAKDFAEVLKSLQTKAHGWSGIAKDVQSGAVVS